MLQGWRLAVGHGCETSCHEEACRSEEGGGPASSSKDFDNKDSDHGDDFDNKDNAHGEGEEEEEEEVKEKDADDEGDVKSEKPDEEAEIEFKVVPGHDTKMTIVVKGTGKDKVQILEINGAWCEGTVWTPRTACQQIAGELQEEAAGKVSSPVKTCAFLPELRALAREKRHSLLELS